MERKEIKNILQDKVCKNCLYIVLGERYSYIAEQNSPKIRIVEEMDYLPKSAL